VSTKLLVTLQGRDEARTVRESGMEVLAEYSDAMLVRGTDEQARRLTDQGIEATPLSEQPVQVTGASFAFEDAARAQEAVEVAPQPGRTAYYLVKLAGPPAPEWLRVLQDHGVEVHLPWGGPRGGGRSGPPGGGDGADDASRIAGGQRARDDHRRARRPAGVKAIRPYAIPELHNDQARLVLRVPVDNVFGT